MDTNILVAALKSRLGYAHRFVLAIGTDKFDIALSVPLVLEYEAVAKRFIGQNGLSTQDVEMLIDYICAVGIQQDIFYLWRPFLPDPKDDMVLEVAVAAGCRYIITYNLKDFRGVERFGVRAVEPKEFLAIIGGER